ncbi:MAG TPA: hypothetical protein VD994_11970, partial [Prosthecobacter sp.]|nr:hypothetical protein [Prosthecobacter sp.]
MIAKQLLHEDEQLKRLVTTPKEQKPQYEWSALLLDAQDGDTPSSSVKVKVGTNERDFDLGEIASTVGNALTDLFLARQQNDNIFTDEN